MHPTAMQTKPTSALPNFTRANLVPDFITRDGVVITISRAATRPKSEKPRSSREGKRSKRLKRQQEKYRERQCRANKEQRHQLSELSATREARYCEYRSQWIFPSSSPTLAIWTNSSSEHPAPICPIPVSYPNRVRMHPRQPTRSGHYVL